MLLETFHMKLMLQSPWLIMNQLVFFLPRCVVRIYLSQETYHPTNLSIEVVVKTAFIVIHEIKHCFFKGLKAESLSLALFCRKKAGRTRRFYERMGHIWNTLLHVCQVFFLNLLGRNSTTIQYCL